MTVQGRLGGNKVYQAFISFGMAVIHQPITLYCPNQAGEGLLALTLPILYICIHSRGVCLNFWPHSSHETPFMSWVLLLFYFRSLFCPGSSLSIHCIMLAHIQPLSWALFLIYNHFSRDKHKTGFPFLHYFTHLTSHCEVQPILYISFLFFSPPSPVLSLPGWSLACGAPFSQLQQQWCWALFNPIISGSQIPMVPGTGVPALPSWLSSLVLFPLLHPELHFSLLMFALGGPNSQCSALEKVT